MRWQTTGSAAAGPVSAAHAGQRGATVSCGASRGIADRMAAASPRGAAPPPALWGAGSLHDADPSTDGRHDGTDCAPPTCPAHFAPGDSLRVRRCLLLSDNG